MLVRSHCTGPRAYQTQSLRRKRKIPGRKKQTLGHGSGELTTEDEVMGQILSIHLYGDWLPIQQQLNAVPCPLLNCSLLGDP